MGKCSVPLTHLEEEEESLRWYPLEGGEGEISIGVTATGWVDLYDFSAYSESFVLPFFGLLLSRFDSRKMGISFSEDHPHWKESSMERHEVGVS